MGGAPPRSVRRAGALPGGARARARPHAEAADDAEVLALMEEGLRHRALGAVIGEARRVGMAATRRLQLAAGGRAHDRAAPECDAHGRNGEGAEPLAAPSAAVTRWRVATAPSAPLPTAGIGCARRTSPSSASVAASPSTPSWRHAMKRVASLYLPDWSIDRVRRAERPAAPPPERARHPGSVDLLPLKRAGNAEQGGKACDAPKNTGWRPGARWARVEEDARPAPCAGRETRAACCAQADDAVLACPLPGVDEVMEGRRAGTARCWAGIMRRRRAPRRPPARAPAAADARDGPAQRGGGDILRTSGCRGTRAASRPARFIAPPRRRATRLGLAFARPLRTSARARPLPPSPRT
ncbi:hypothetical protein AB5I41_19800 [Sphingomonas sp. MMS24-JH45]